MLTVDKVDGVEYGKGLAAANISQRVIWPLHLCVERTWSSLETSAGTDNCDATRVIVACNCAPDRRSHIILAVLLGPLEFSHSPVRPRTPALRT